MSAGCLCGAPCQPATHYADACDPEYPVTFTAAPRSLIWCECCRRRRWARYVEVQVYYDGVRRWCAPGRGCKGAKHGR